MLEVKLQDQVLSTKFKYSISFWKLKMLNNNYYLYYIHMCLEYYLETHKNIYFLIKCAIFQEKPRQLHNLYTLNLFILFFFFNLAAPGLSCGMWDLVPWPGTQLSPLHWERKGLGQFFT